MDKALFLAMSGAKQNTLAQQALTNNIANVGTTGFKADLTQARSQPVFGDFYASRVYAETERPTTDFSQGGLIETGRDLDIAVRGEGWIAVQAPDGNEAYTREGDLNIDANGILRTGTGLPVLDGGGAIIAVPPADSIEVGADGTISIVPDGQGPDAIAEIARIKFVNPPAESLEKGLDGLIRIREDSGEPIPALADANVRVESGFLEASNVNIIAAMTDIVGLSRQFELQVQVMQAADENEERTAQLLQIN